MSNISSNTSAYIVMPDFLTRRGNLWHFVRRVPLKFTAFDKRGIVRRSTRIRIADDRLGRRAARIAQKMNEDLELQWRSLTDGQSEDSLSRYDEARRRARMLGYDHIANGQLLSSPIERVLERLEALVAKGLVEDKGARTALRAQRPSQVSHSRASSRNTRRRSVMRRAISHRTS